MIPGTIFYSMLLCSAGMIYLTKRPNDTFIMMPFFISLSKIILGSLASRNMYRYFDTVYRQSINIRLEGAIWGFGVLFSYYNENREISMVMSAIFYHLMMMMIELHEMFNEMLLHGRD